MHIKQLYQIFDVKAESVVGPILRENKDGPAIRYFHGALSDKSMLLGMHPEDYQLLSLGAQDEETGEINSEVRVVTSGQAWLEIQQSRDASSSAASENGTPHFVNHMGTPIR